MSWRNLIIGNPAKLSLSRNSVLIERSGQPAVSVPLEDISCIVLDSPQVTLTAPLLSALRRSSAALVLCDASHMPCGIPLGFHQHSRTLKAFQLQLESSLPFLKNCWRLVVKQKIRNQASCLALLGIDGASELFALAGQVKSGDPDNREAVAALSYFNVLFPGLKRREDNVINGALNYGYAIMRGCVARHLAAYGFQPALGIHHRSELNSFNLADDFIEPFRPVVDLWAYQNMRGARAFEQKHRIELVSLLGCLISVGNERVTVQRAADMLCSSYVTASRARNPSLLLLPQLIALQMGRNE